MTAAPLGEAEATMMVPFFLRTQVLRALRPAPRGTPRASDARQRGYPPRHDRTARIGLCLLSSVARLPVFLTLVTASMDRLTYGAPQKRDDAREE